MNKISIALLLTINIVMLGMDSWPKDKPVPFNSLPIEYISSDDESEPQPPHVCC